MSLLISILLLLAGFLLLIKGAGVLVAGASSLAKKYRISELAIGLTVVAFGTSAPELVVNIISSAKGLNDLVMGNIIGSNLFNLLAILGIAGIIYPLTVHSRTVWKEIPYSLFAVIILFVIANDVFLFGATNNIISRFDGIILLAFFILFMFYIAFNLRQETVVEEVGGRIFTLKKTMLYIVAGMAGLVIGGKLVVDNAIEIATVSGVSDKLIALTIVAAGTSLPELATSAVASFRKKSDIAVGNIIGSNIFNIFLILGTSAVIKPLPFNTVFNDDLYIIAAAIIFLFAAMFMSGRKLFDRWEAIVYVIVFLLYMVFIISRK